MKPTAKFSASWKLGLCALLALQAACETTGNPREGGLVGWSQRKADERRDELEREDTSAQGRVAEEEKRRQALQSQQGGLTAEVQRLRAEVDRLLAENTQLEGQLRDMMGRKQIGEKELARLGELLKQNERLRQSLVNPPDRGAGRAAMNERASAMNQQNQQLHREIMALLGR